MQQQQIVVVGLQPLHVRPVALCVVIRQRDEIQACSPRSIEYAMRRNFRLYVSCHYRTAIAVSRMRMKVASEPGGLMTDHWKGRFLAIQLLDCDGVCIHASLPDIRHTENHSPTAWLYRTGKISIAGEGRTNNDVLRTSAAPAPESSGPSQAEIDYGSSIAASISQADPETPCSRSYIESPFEQMLVILAGERTKDS